MKNRLRVEAHGITLEELHDEITLSYPAKRTERDSALRDILRELHELRQGQKYFNAAINFAYKQGYLQAQSDIRKALGIVK